jgi:two-component sensor histidine kinase
MSSSCEEQNTTLQVSFLCTILHITNDGRGFLSLNRLSLRSACADLSGILGTQIEVRGDEGKVPTTRIQPIGLLLNELITNAAKHGAGKINVEYKIEGAKHELSVCDQGSGLPSGFDAEQTSGLGMKVVNTLVRQLGGS